VLKKRIAKEEEYSPIMITEVLFDFIFLTSLGIPWSFRYLLNSKQK